MFIHREFAPEFVLFLESNFGGKFITTDLKSPTEYGRILLGETALFIIKTHGDSLEVVTDERLLKTIVDDWQQWLVFNAKRLGINLGEDDAKSNGGGNDDDGDD